MQLPGVAGQQKRDLLFDASGTITTGGVAQLVLAEAKSRSFLLLMNLDPANALYIQFGGALAGAVTLASGVITAVAVANGGFGYTVAPDVLFLGGGTGGNPAYKGVGQPGYDAPGNPGNINPRYQAVAGRPAKAHATLSGSSVNAIVIDDGGSGYSVAPYVALRSALTDPYGAATPSATSGILLAPNGGAFYVNGPVCPTDAVSIFGATTGTAFTCKYMP